MYKIILTNKILKLCPFYTNVSVSNMYVVALDKIKKCIKFYNKIATITQSNHMYIFQII